MTKPLTLAEQVAALAALGYGWEDICVKLKLQGNPLMREWVRGLVLFKKG